VGWALLRFRPNLTSKACRLCLGPKTSKDSKRHPVQMPGLLLERRIRLYLRVSEEVWEIFFNLRVFIKE